MHRALVAASLAFCLLHVPACKSDGTGGLVEAATSGDAGAVKGAATEAAKAEATAQAEAQVAEAARAAQAQNAAAQVQGTLTRTTPSANYPSRTCIVTGDPLPPAPFAYTWQGREVQFCCAGCASDFLKDPAAYLARLDAAR